MLVNAINPAGMARCRTLLAETARRNAAGTLDADEALRDLSVAAAIEKPLWGLAIDISDGRHFRLALRGVTLRDALVHAIQTYIPVDAVELIIGISGGKVDAIPDEACLA